MSAQKKESSINVNTLLISILTLLSGWTLKTLVDQGTTVAAMVQQVVDHTKQLDNHEMRIQNIEQDMYKRPSRPGRPSATGASNQVP